MRVQAALAVVLAGTLALTSACKPPPTDADIDRPLPQAEPTYASDPLPSPVTEGAVWAPSAKDPQRIIYGVPGETALLTLTCLADSAPPRLRITRLSRADEGAGALLAMVGNGHIGRIAVDAVDIGGRNVWQGEALAADLAWEPLVGPRELIATVPGAGMVTINPGEAAWKFVMLCREGIAPPVLVPEAERSPIP